MSKKRRLLLQDENGNLVEPEVLASEVLMENGQTAEEAIEGAGNVNTITLNGDTVEPDENGDVKLSIDVPGQAQADWDENDSSSPSYIKHKPTIPAGVVVDPELDVESDNAISNSAVAAAIAQIRTALETLKAAGVSVTTVEDGTFTIHAGGNDYTVNLNHTHPNMAKLVVCVESDLPSTLDPATIYVQVDDLQSPGEIQKLYFFGLAFEGGGGVIDETPRIVSPAVGTEIDFRGQSSTTLRVKGLYLSSQLTVTSTGSITVTANGNAVSTISATDANNGIELTIAKGANFSNEDCSLTFDSSEVSRTVVVKDSTMLPGGLFANKAWATRAAVQTPVELSGYCITKFRVPTQASGRMKVSVKAGFTIQSSGLDYIGCALNKGADNNTNFTSTDAWGQSTDPKLLTPAAGDGTAISATFKTSEIANCYIYDHNAGQYLWAGENVDTSVAPPIPS